MEESESAGSEKEKKFGEALSFSEEESEIAPLPSSGKIGGKEVVKKALRARSDSDFEAEYSTLSSSEASKIVLLNMQSKQTSGSSTSGTFTKVIIILVSLDL